MPSCVSSERDSWGMMSVVTDIIRTDDPGIPPHGGVDPVHYRRRWLILAVVLAAECMDLIDSTVVNVAAPKIAHDFHATSTSLQWIVGGYPLAIAVGLILGGRLGDLVGRKRMFILGAVGFVAASIMCGASSNTGMLIAARLIQGSFSAMMLPQGFGILREVFPADEQQSAFAVFGPVIAFSSVLGPIIGGSIIDWNPWGTGWRFVFLINVPLGLAAIIGAIRLVPKSRPNRGVRLDLVGTVLVSLFAVLLVYPLIQGREDGWPWWTYASMLLGIAMLVVFAVHQRRQVRLGVDPLVLPSVFSHRGYSAGLLFAVFFFSGFGGTLLCTTLFLQIGQGFTPIHAALCTVPLSVGLIIGAGLSGSLLGPKFGRRTLQAGVVVSGLGWVLFIVALRGHGTINFVNLLPGLMVAGAGLGLVVAPMFDIVLASVTEEETGSGSGVLNAAQQLASSIGVAVMGTVFFDAIFQGNFHGALTRVLVIQAIVMVGLLVLSPLLPRMAREEAPPGAPASAPADPAADPAAV
jgi:EmrB/QacA subfamily drug resistance transporter